MASYTLRRLDRTLVEAARTRARDAGTSLEAVLLAYLTQYASGESQQADAGRARWAGRSAEERRAHAMRMVDARRPR